MEQQTTGWQQGGEEQRVAQQQPPRPAIDFDRVGGIDLERLERSLQLRGERVGMGRYRVMGGAQDHWVDLYTTSHPRCDCGDHLWREQLCKHILAALLREGNDRVVGALGRLFAELRELSRAA
ncbi:MAG: SWIM zinc finger family protein [Gemmatimonadaceae bacterium]